MVDPKDTRKPVRTALELFVAKLRATPPAPPERSYFTKPEPDRDEERKASARRAQAATAQRAVRAVADRARLEKAFAPAALADESRLDQRIAAIAQDDLREAAIEAREDARELLAINQAELDQVRKDDRLFWDRFDTSRPVPEDTAKQQNLKTRTAEEALFRIRFAVQDTMERTIADCEGQSWRRTPQITHEQGLLTYQPAEPATASGWLTEIHRAAALPLQPKPPGQDVPR